ncbi:hypothetical protein V8C86DRAFT_2442622 [Haematococcus lacustris]
MAALKENCDGDDWFSSDIEELCLSPSLPLCAPVMLHMALNLWPISDRCTCSCCRGSADCDSCVLMILPTLPPFECSSSSRCFAFRETTKCACVLSEALWGLYVGHGVDGTLCTVAAIADGDGALE